MIKYDVKDFESKKYKNDVACFCSHCFKTFYRKKRNLIRRMSDGTKNIYCSEMCKQLHLGQESSRQVSCETCNKVFKKQGNRIRKTNHNFCCRSCSVIYNNKKRKLSPKIKIKREINIKLCEICGDVVVHSGRKYCSNACNPCRTDYSEITIGMWKDKYNTWQVNAKVRDHSRRIFTQSGKEKVCFVCGYNKHIHICHIKPVVDFADDITIKECNNLDNLIPLCPNHHWEFDNKLINI